MVKWAWVFRITVECLKGSPWYNLTYLERLWREEHLKTSKSSNCNERGFHKGKEGRSDRQVNANYCGSCWALSWWYFVSSWACLCVPVRLVGKNTLDSIGSVNTSRMVGQTTLETLMSQQMSVAMTMPTYRCRLMVRYSKCVHQHWGGSSILKYSYCYFFARTAADGLPAADFKSRNKSAENLCKCGHVQNILLCTKNRNNKEVWVKAICLPEMRWVQTGVDSRYWKYRNLLSSARLQ